MTLDISNMLHGGYTILLPALETLASMEETVVRDAVRLFREFSSIYTYLRLFAPCKPLVPL